MLRASGHATDGGLDKTLVAVLGFIAVFALWFQVIYRWWMAAVMCVVIAVAVWLTASAKLPLLMYAEDRRVNGTGVLRYSVIFSNEDGGTATPAKSCTASMRAAWYNSAAA